MTNKSTNEEIDKWLDENFPRRGCENCWGDLHRGCDEQCQNESRNYAEARQFILDRISEAEEKGREEVIKAVKEWAEEEMGIENLQIDEDAYISYKGLLHLLTKLKGK